MMTSNKMSETTKSHVLQGLHNLPMAFVPNAGQSHAKVEYHAHGSSIFMTREEVLFVLSEPPEPQRARVEHSLLASQCETSMEAETTQRVAALRFLNAHPNVHVEARRKTAHIVNFLRGNDHDKWYTNLPTYSELVYRDLWPGIDLVLKGPDGRLKYEFVVQPGARVEDIRLAYQGADDVSLDEQGNLEIQTALGSLVDEKPLSYQEINGQRVPVKSHFSVWTNPSGERVHGFEIGKDYRSEHILIIDPSLAYSTYLGGSRDDQGFDIAVDSSGNAYVTGRTYSTDFPTTSGASQSSLAGDSDAFVTKLDATGSGLVYSTYLGGSSTDYGYGIAVDATGNAYVTGRTYSPNFPTTASGYQTSLGGNSDVFVTKLNHTGSSLVYSTYLGGSAYDIGSGIAIDGTGSAYVTGQTSSTNFPTTSSAYQTSLAGGSDAFVTKLNPTGSSLVYSTYLGGSNYDTGSRIAVDELHNGYITGYTNSTNFPTTTGAYQTSNGGGYDAFVTKIDTTGSNLIYSTYLGGSSNDQGFDIAVDEAEYAFMTGYTNSTDFPITSGAYQTSKGGGYDVFVTRLNPTGSGLEYSTYLGGSSNDIGLGITIDETGSTFVTGYTYSTNFPITYNAYQISLKGASDVFVTKLNPTGSSVEYSTYLGGSMADFGEGIVVDVAGNAFVTGYTYSSDFPTTQNAFQSSLNGAQDAFITKLEIPSLVVELEDKMAVDLTLKVLQNQQVHVATTAPAVMKVPVVLAEPTLHFSIDDLVTLPIPSTEIKSVENRLKLTQCLLALPSNVLFLKGFVRKTIQYVTSSESTNAPGATAVTDYTVDIPFSFTTDLTGKYLNLPALPSMNTRAGFEFFTSTALPTSVPHSSKDRLLAGDLTQFDQQSQEFFSELPYCELISARFVDYLESLEAPVVDDMT